MRIVLGAALLTCAVMLSGPASGADGDARTDTVTTKAEIFAALERDPILIQSVMGSGYTKQIHDRLTRYAAELDVPVYVALVATPKGAAEVQPAKELVTLLRDRLGRGIFVAATTTDPLPQIEIEGLTHDATDLSLAHSELARSLQADGSLSPGAETELLLRLAANDGRPLPDAVVDEVSALPWAYQSKQTYDRPVHESVAGKRALFTGLAGLLALLLTARALLYVRSRRPTPAAGRTPDSSPPAVRRRAERDVRKLSHVVERMSSVKHDRLADNARLARDLAERLLAESRADPGRLGDLVGALAVARAGIHDAHRAQQAEPGGAYHPCFLNPLHGKATEHAVVGESVPVCHRCRTTLDRKQPPDSFRPPRRGRDRPYFELDDIWARTGYGALVDDLAVLVLEERSST